MPEAPALPAQRTPDEPAPRTAGPAVAAPSVQLRTDLSARTWPCSACAQPNDLALAACAACGTPFLAAARDAPPTLVLPVVGDLLGLSPVRRVGLAVGLVVAFVLISCLLGLLLA